MVQYNRARERGVVCMQSRSYYGANGASAPPDFSGTFYSAENALKFTYSKVEFQKISGGNTPGPPL